MPRTPPQVRRFTIADSMILIAMLAPGLALSSRAWYQLLPLASNEHVWGRYWEWAMLACAVGFPSLVALTIATIVVRVRRPRPAWKRAMRQPGVTACLVVLFWLTIAVLIIFGVIVIEYTHDPSTRRESVGELAGASLVLLSMCTAPVAVSVLVAWLVLAIQTGWRCERGWIDRLGRFLGSTWIVMGAIIGVELLRSTFFD